MICVDNESPVLENCPANLTLYVPSNSTELTVNWTFPTATDNSGQVMVHNATFVEVDVTIMGEICLNFFGFLRLKLHFGLTISNITAEDAAGNIDQCIAHIWIIGEFHN